MRVCRVGVLSSASRSETVDCRRSGSPNALQRGGRVAAADRVIRFSRSDSLRPIHDELRLLAFSTNQPLPGREIALRADENSIGALVWRDQKPLILSPLPDALENEDLVRRVMERGINLPLVPLSNGARQLGILMFGFTEPANGDRCRGAGSAVSSFAEVLGQMTSIVFATP